MSFGNDRLPVVPSTGLTALLCARSEQPLLYRRLLATELFELLDTDADGFVDFGGWNALIGATPHAVQKDFAAITDAWPLAAASQPEKMSLNDWLGALQCPDLKCLSDAEYEHGALALQVSHSTAAG